MPEVIITCDTCQATARYNGIVIEGDPDTTIALLDNNTVFQTCPNGHHFQVTKEHLSVVVVE